MNMTLNLRAPSVIKVVRRSRHRFEDNIEIDLKEIGVNMRNWIDSAHDRDYWRTLVNAALYLQVP